VNALILFDIDGTLIDTRGAGRGALEEGFFSAFPERAGEPFPPLDLGGATDAGVARFLFGHFGIEESDAGRESFFAAYAVALRQRLHLCQGEGEGRLLPGVAALLETLGSAGFPPLGLLTVPAPDVSAPPSRSRSTLPAEGRARGIRSNTLQSCK